jgi:hypothetical protein
MKLAVAILADSAIANPQDGKLYVLGGGISSIGAGAFPATHPALSLALNLEFAPSECEKSHQVEVHLLDPDGRELLPPFRQSIVPQKNPMDPTLPSGWVTVFNYVGLTFPKPAENAFSVLVDGHEVASLPLRIIQAARPVAA